MPETTVSASGSTAPPAESLTDTPQGAAPVSVPRRRRSRWLVWLSILGPGIVATAAGNDAGGILTYIQTGAQFQYSLIWSIVLVTISYYVVEEMCARMGAVTGKGLADLIRENYGVKVTLFAMIIQLIANLATTVTEFAGIAAACRAFGLSDPLTRFIAVPASIGITWMLVVGNSYAKVERIFLLMSALLLTYVVVALKLHPDWATITHQAIFPPIHHELKMNGAAYINMLIALIGTTIAPYQQFYLQSAVRDKGTTIKQHATSRMDVLIGCVLSNAISIFIVIACAITLYAHGVRNITDAGQASIALEPIAGAYARYLFGIGLLGASLLAAVVVPLTTAYAVTESLGWETGVGRQLKESPLFYITYGIMLLIGGGIVMLPIHNLITLIIQAQVLNGALLPVELVLIILLSSKRRLMGNYRNSAAFSIVAWVTVCITIALSVANLFLSVIPAAP
jgi:NRAMP (natural resistance-associated macrophage protein)-like metal ion transporter